MRTTHAGLVVSLFGVAGIAALIAVVVPFLTADDGSDPAPSGDVPSSCLTPTPTSADSDADWTICWDN
jgi:hypothetical protein